MQYKEGIMFHNPINQRYDIRFLDDLDEDGEEKHPDWLTHGGLQCGTCLSAKINGEWHDTQIELADRTKTNNSLGGYYLVGFRNTDLDGLRVRI